MSTAYCEQCGAEFTMKRAYQRFCCKACQVRYNVAKSNAKAKEQRAMINNGRPGEYRTAYTVVRDALSREQGGFPPGAEISKVEMAAMLKDRTVTAGTVLARGKSKYIIRSKSGGLAIERMTQ